MFLQSARTKLGLRLLKLLVKTWRVEESFEDDIRKCVMGESPAVIAFRHGQMLPIWYRFRGGVATAVVSHSSDGDILATFLMNRLGYRRIIRGSSSRGGAEVMNAMTEELAAHNVLITPDGPRGPAGEPKPGCAVAAFRANRPLIAARWVASRSIQLSSWDSMRIPLPLARIHITYRAIPIVENEDGAVSETTMDNLRREMTPTAAPGDKP